MVINGRLAIAIASTVFGQVLYHVIARGSSSVRSAWELVAVAYSVSLAIVIVIGVLIDEISIGSTFSGTNLIRGVGLGIAVALVELGYIYAYRSGLPITTGALSVLAITTLALAPIGVLFFGDPLSLRIGLGAFLAVVGIWLVMS